MEQVFPFPEGKFKRQFHSQISATHSVCKFLLMILLNYISFFYVYLLVNFLSRVIFMLLLFKLHQHILSYSKIKEKQKLTEIKN